MYTINVKMNFSNWSKTIVKIKMIILITLFTIVNSCVSMKNVKVVDTTDYKYLKLKQQFAWMNPEIYGIIKSETERQEKNLPVLYKTIKGVDNKYYKVIIKLDFIKFVSSIVMAESGEYCHNNYEWMKIVISCAGAQGLMQIMKVHTPNNPESRKDPKINVQKGVSYFTTCLQKSAREGHRNPLQIACLYYNAGSHAKIWRYKNWGYVNKIARYYGA